jgi:hypothetical protein
VELDEPLAGVRQEQDPAATIGRPAGVGGRSHWVPPPWTLRAGRGGGGGGHVRSAGQLGSTVSQILEDTRERYRRWCKRRLEEHDLVYLFLDAI